MLRLPLRRATTIPLLGCHVRLSCRPFHSSRVNLSFLGKLRGGVEAIKSSLSTPKTLVQPTTETPPPQPKPEAAEKPKPKNVFEALGLDPKGKKPSNDLLLQLHPMVLLALAQDYFLGRAGLPQDIPMAIAVWEIAADKGNPDAICSLCLLVLHDQAVKSQKYSTYQEALNALEPLEFGRAKFIVGIHYKQGIHVQKDLAKAKEALLRAHELGEPQAAIHLSEMVETDDPEKFRELLKASSDGGDARAGFRLASELTKLGKHEEAFGIYRRQADTSPAASFNVGMAYLTGQGVAQDSRFAVKFIKKAADANFWPAKCNMANFFMEGLIIEKDLPTAEHMFQDILANGPPEYRQFAQDRLKELKS